MDDTRWNKYHRSSKKSGIAIVVNLAMSRPEWFPSIQAFLLDSKGIFENHLNNLLCNATLLYTSLQCGLGRFIGT